VFHNDGVRLRRLDETWRAATAAIGRPGLLFHDLRRSAVRLLRRAGVDPQVIMQLGGWKTPSVFARYNIVEEQDLAEAQATLDRVLATPGARTVIPLRRPAGAL
jgi:integrase